MANIRYKSFSVEEQLKNHTEVGTTSEEAGQVKISVQDLGFSGVTSIYRKSKTHCYLEFSPKKQKTNKQTKKKTKQKTLRPVGVVVIVGVVVGMTLLHKSSLQQSRGLEHRPLSWQPVIMKPVRHERKTSV